MSLLDDVKKSQFLRGYKRLIEFNNKWVQFMEIVYETKKLGHVTDENAELFISVRADLLNLLPKVSHLLKKGGTSDYKPPFSNYVLRNFDVFPNVLIQMDNLERIFLEFHPGLDYNPVSFIELDGHLRTGEGRIKIAIGKTELEIENWSRFARFYAKIGLFFDWIENHFRLTFLLIITVLFILNELFGWPILTRFRDFISL